MFVSGVRFDGFGGGELVGTPKVDNESSFSGQWNTTTPEFPLQSGSLIQGLVPTFAPPSTYPQGPHNTIWILPTSPVQVAVVTPSAGNPSHPNMFIKGNYIALTNGAPMVGSSVDGGGLPPNGNIFAPDDPDNITYSVTFDLSDLYDLTEIRTYARHIGGRTDQKYKVQVASSMAGTFTDIPGAVVNYLADFSLQHAGSRYLTTEVVISTTGFLATNVGAVRFVIDNPTNQGFNTTYWSELQIFGQIVPEPSSLALVGLAGLLSLRRRRSS